MGNLSVQQLSPKQKKIGQRKYLFFSVFNTLSFVTVTDNVLILFALKMGASDFSIAILAALGYLTMPAMVLGKMLTNKVGITRTFGLGWIFSGLVAGLLLLVPTVAERSSSLMAIILICLAAGGYHFFRNVGITAMTPLLGAITSQKDQGSFLSRLWMTTNFALLFIITGNAFILGNTPSTTVFIRLIAVGILAELIASYFMFTIPAVPDPESKEKEKLIDTARYVWANKPLRHFFLCWLLLFSGMALTGPFNILAMKKGYLFSEKAVILFTLISVCGGIIVSFINRLLLDRVGPRPMLFLYTAGLALGNFLWAIAPKEPSYYHIILIFLLAGICLNGINTSLYFYLLNRTPEKKRMNTSILIYMISGIFTALVSSLAGGGLLNLLRALSLTGLRVYQFYFLVIGVYQIIVASQVYRLEPLQDRKITDVLSIILSTRGWRALNTLDLLSRSEDEGETLYLVDKLGDIGSDLSEKVLQKYLQSPRFFLRVQALQALADTPFGAETAQILIQELEDDEQTIAYMAAEILGERQVREAIPSLRKAMQSKDLFLQGKAVLALAKLNDEPSFGEIVTLFDETRNSRLTIHAGHALVYMNKPALARHILFKMLQHKLRLPVYEELLFCICEIFDANKQFFTLHNEYWEDETTGKMALQDFLQTEVAGHPAQEGLQEALYNMESPSLALKALTNLPDNPADKELRQLITLLLLQLPEMDNSEYVPQLIFSLILMMALKQIPGKKKRKSKIKRSKKTTE